MHAMLLNMVGSVLIQRIPSQARAPIRRREEAIRVEGGSVPHHPILMCKKMYFLFTLVHESTSVYHAAGSYSVWYVPSSVLALLLSPPALPPYSPVSPISTTSKTFKT
jgi:hypothetical protein